MVMTALRDWAIGGPMGKGREPVVALDLQQLRSQQFLRRDRRPATQRMVWPHSLLRRKVAEHIRLLMVLTAHVD
jgi:hypothetical protein